MPRAVLAATAASLILMLPATAFAQWSAETPGTTETLRAVHFVSRTHGWAAGYGGVIIATTNGGATWSPQNSGATNRFLSIRFLDASNGWAGAGAKIVRTTNGGATWNNVTLDPNALIFRDSLFPVSPTVAWVSAGGGMPSARWLYRYTINPDTSVTEQAFDVVGSSAKFFDLFFVNADNGWAVGTGGVIRRITNASSGTPGFAFQTSGTAQQLNGIFMLDLQRGWIVGNGGTILRTTNGGTTWSPQTSGTVSNLRDVYFVNGRCGWVVGENGVILRTTDGGATWALEASNVTTTLWGVDGIAAGHVAGGDFSVSANGTMLKHDPPDLMVAGGFEDGTFNEWTTTQIDGGDLSVSAAAAAPGTAFGVQAFIDDQAGIYVQDDTPLDETRYRGRFHFDPNGFDPGEAANRFRTRVFLGFEENPIRRLFAIVLRRRDNVYAIAARVTRDDGTRATTPFTVISDGPHLIEFDWRRATGPDSGDGAFDLWIDETPVATLAAIDNGSNSLDFARMGALSVKAGASGILFWDELELRRQTYIGGLNAPGWLPFD
jgi:photosystem II stability/assembly factor-like uncharacterized protein